MEVRPEVLQRLRGQAAALRNIGKARDEATTKVFCSCCCEYFQPGEDRRSLVCHMHENCIDQLLSPDGKPVIGLTAPPRFNRPAQAPAKIDFTPGAPHMVSDKAVEDLAEKIADRMDWLTEASREQLVKDVADEVIARLKPTLERWEQAVEKLEGMLDD